MANRNGLSSSEPKAQRGIVVTLLWVGTMLAIVGLWFPDWMRPLAGTTEPFLNLALFKTPVLTYVGEILLWIACVMVVGFYVRRGKAILYLGLFSTFIAILSSVLALIGITALFIMVLTTVALFTATLFIYLALKDMLGRFGWLILVMNFIGFVLGSGATITGAFYSMSGTVPLAYAMMATYTISWLLAAILLIPSHYQAMVEAKKEREKPISPP